MLDASEIFAAILCSLFSSPLYCCSSGSANPMLSNQDVVEANKLVNALLDLKSEPISSGMYITLELAFVIVTFY